MEVMNLLRLSGYVRIALVGLESVNAVAAPTGEAAQAPE
jgi:biopolymer transport protein ExbD